MTELLRTNSKNPDFISLVNSLDEELAVKDGDDHAFYDQFNAIENLNHVVILYSNGKPSACGAIKKINSNTVEIKRMFTLTDFRGNGLASKVLLELEKWAKELSFDECILETGKYLFDAIRLYEKNGYLCIPNYPPYEEAVNSQCFAKQL